MSETVLYLVRHAHAEWAEEIARDWSRPLSPRGLADAERLADLLEDRPIAAVYASSERRAAQTVAPLAARKGLEVREEHDLRERHLMDGKAEDFVAAVRATWDDPDLVFPGGESNRSAQERGLAAVRRISASHPGAEVVIGTHGTLLALILRGLLPETGFDLWLGMTFPDVYRLSVPGLQDCKLSRVWVPGLQDASRRAPRRV